MKHGECDLPRISKEKLERAILAQLKEIFGNGALVKELVERVNRKLRKKVPDLKKELEAVERRIKGKEQLADLYFEKFERKGSLSPLVEKRLRGIAEEHTELEKTKGEIRTRMEVGQFQPVRAEDIQRVIGNLEKALLQAPPSEVKQLLRLIIKRVDIYSPELIQPYYRIPRVRIESGLAPRAGLEPNTLKAKPSGITYF